MPKLTPTAKTSEGGVFIGAMLDLASRAPAPSEAVKHSEYESSPESVIIEA